MVLKVSEFHQYQVEQWKNYNLDHEQIKLDIKKLVKKLNALNKSYHSKLSQIHNADTLATLAAGASSPNSPVAPPAAAAIGDALACINNNGDAAAVAAAAGTGGHNNNETPSTFVASSSPITATKNSEFNVGGTPNPGSNSGSLSNYYSSSSSSNVSSLNLDSERELSTEEAKAKIKHIVKSYQEKKTRLIVNFLSNSLIKHLKNVNLFINLKDFQLIRNFQANSNNFKRNHKNIVTEIFTIQQKFKGYQETLSNEAALNNDFLTALHQFKTSSNPDVNAIPRFPSDQDIKKLNLDIVSRNSNSINKNNTKLDQKINEFKNDLFLNLKNFIIFQKLLVCHILHFLNKTILKLCDIRIQNGEQTLQYTDALYLVKSKYSLSKSKSLGGLVSAEFMKESQKELALSFHERYELFKTIFEKILNADFDHSAINSVFGNTIYEREFIYFGKFTNGLVRKSKAKGELLFAGVPNSDPENFTEYQFKPEICALDVSDIVRERATKLLNNPIDSIAEKSQYSHDNINFWNIKLAYHYRLISDTLLTTNHNLVMYSKIARLINIITNQRSLIYDSSQLNYVYQSNSLNSYVIDPSEIHNLQTNGTTTTTTTSSSENDSSDQDISNAQMEFDLSSAKCINAGWFIVPKEYTCEVTFLLDSLFINNDQKLPDEDTIASTIKHINTDKSNFHKQHQSVQYFDQLDASTSELCHLSPLSVFAGYEEDIAFAVGVINSLGKFAGLKLSTELLLQLETNSDLVAKLLLPNAAENDEAVSSVIAKYFKNDLIAFKKFQKLFGQRSSNIAKFSFAKSRYLYQAGKKSKFTNCWISCYSDVTVSCGDYVHVFPYTVIEVDWDSNAKFSDSVTKLINSNFLYEVPSFSPYIYSRLIFDIVKDGEEEEDQDEDEDEENDGDIDLSWFYKVTDKKFHLKSIIDNRLMRNRQKLELASKLQEQEQEIKQDKTAGAGGAGAAGDNANSLHKGTRSEIRYWNEFDDNPEEWGNDGNNGFFIDTTNNNHANLISDTIIDFLLNVTQSISKRVNKINRKVKTISGSNQKQRNRLRRAGLRSDPLSPTSNDNRRHTQRHPNRFVHTSHSSTNSYSYESSDDEASQRNLMSYYDPEVGYGTFHHNTDSAAAAAAGINNTGTAGTDPTVPATANYSHPYYDKYHKDGPSLGQAAYCYDDPEITRAYNHDIVATFLYFIFPTVSAIITGSSMGIFYSVVFDPEVETSIVMLTILACSLIIAFILSTLSVLLLFGRITAAPVHHYMWVWSVFLAVLLAIVFVLTEFVEM